MRAQNLISHSIPFLRVQDTARRALQLMSDFHITHLPVVGEDLYLGLVEENELLDTEDDNETLADLEIHWNRVGIGPDEHFLSVLRLVEKAAAQRHTCRKSRRGTPRGDYRRRIAAGTG